MKKFRAYLISGITKENAKEYIQNNFERWKYLNASEASDDSKEDSEIDKAINRFNTLVLPDKEGNSNFKNITYSNVDSKGNELTKLRFLNEQIEQTNLHKDEICKQKDEVKSAFECYLVGLMSEKKEVLFNNFQNATVTTSKNYSFVKEFKNFDDFFWYFNQYANKGISFVFHDFSNGIDLASLDFEETLPNAEMIKAFYVLNRKNEFNRILTFEDFITREKSLLKNYKNLSVGNFKTACISVLKQLKESDFEEDKSNEKESSFDETANVTALFLYYINKTPRAKKEADEELRLDNFSNVKNIQKALDFLRYKQAASTIRTRLHNVGKGIKEDPLTDNNLNRVIELLENFGFNEAKEEAKKSLKQ